MRRDMKPGDSLTLTLNGETHVFGPDRVRVSVVETSARERGPVRYALITVPLGEEFPEDVGHATG